MEFLWGYYLAGGAVMFILGFIIARAFYKSKNNTLIQMLREQDKDLSEWRKLAHNANQNAKSILKTNYRLLAITKELNELIRLMQANDLQKGEC